MSKYLQEEGSNKTKIEAGQILNPDSFPLPNELVCVQVPKVFDQVAERDCVTRCIQLKNDHGNSDCSRLSFEGATNFDIVEIKVVSETDSLTKAGFKKLKLFVRIKYTILLSDGERQFTKDDEATFNLTINEIYCPGCLALIGIIKSPNGSLASNKKTVDHDGSFIKVEALAEAFNDSINHHGVLTLDIGAFFIVKCVCTVQLLIPAYGYCPVPHEQNANSSLQSGAIFKDWTKTPFPTQFYPDQKWNPLDENKEKHWAENSSWDE